MIGITGLVKWITLPWLRFHYKLTFSASSCSQSFLRIFIRTIRSHFRTMINSFMPIDYDFQFRALFSCKKRKKKRKKKGFNRNVWPIDWFFLSGLFWFDVVVVAMTTTSSSTKFICKNSFGILMGFLTVII